MPQSEKALFDGYLRLLGVDRRPPSWRALGELASSHLMRVPFESLSKIYSGRCRARRWTPSLEEFLDGVEYHHFGGTCYVNNYYMNRLLNHLGYDATLCAADIAREGAPQNSHMVSVVHIDGREAIVDVGYGAPFWQPLPRDKQDDYVVVLGRERFVLKPKGSDGRSRLEVYRDGALVHGYLAKPEPRRVEDFHSIIERSYSDGAPFMNALILVRFYPGRSVSIRNFAMIEVSDGETRVQKLGSRGEVAEAIEEHFDIERGVIDEVMVSLPELRELGE